MKQRKTVRAEKQPKSEDIKTSYWHTWQQQCRRLAPDEWQKAARRTRRIKNGTIEYKVIEYPPQKIADMHVMQLVHTIKWCVRLAHRECSNFKNFGKTQADLLAPIPQWRSLVEEA